MNPIIKEITAAQVKNDIAPFKVGDGVRVHTNSRVAEVGPTGVKLATGAFLPAELVVWAAGVKAPDFLQIIAAASA